MSSDLRSLALLELFSVCEDVFTEDQAFSREKINVSLGRIYRSYKEARKLMMQEAETWGRGQ